MSKNEIVAKREFLKPWVEQIGKFHAHYIVYCGPGHEHMHASFIVK